MVICDDHQLVSDALKMAVKLSSQLSLVTDPVSRAEDAIRICERLHPDVCVMDVVLGTQPNGIQATRSIRGVSSDTNVLIVSAYKNDETVLSAIEAGAVGFVHKGESLRHTLEAIVDVGRGRTVIDHDELPAILQRASAERAARAEAQMRMDRLTAREREVLSLLLRGKGNEEIAGTLYVSPRTVETHVQHILRKLGAHSKLQAVALASQHEGLAS